MKESIMNTSEFERKVFDEVETPLNKYWPLRVRIIEGYKRSSYGESNAEVMIEWAGKEIRFVAEIINRTSPQLIESRALKLLNKSQRTPLLFIVPYLSDSLVRILQERQISGLDLNGNYYLITPELVAIRLDKKNEYKESTTIRKIYSGASSVVCRYLLTTNNLPREMGEITNEIVSRGGGIANSTVSKVLKRLEEELIISKKINGIQVIQREKLLDNLVNNYIDPKISAQRKLKVPQEALLFLENKMLGISSNLKWSISGISSAGAYTVATSPQAIEIYLKKIPSEWLQWEDNRFYNIVLKETTSDFVYFDIFKKENLRFASKLQTYIELSRGDKREKETGETLRKELLR